MSARYTCSSSIPPSARTSASIRCASFPTCGDALALEHTGDLYSCDHFVEPDFKLGNIRQTHMADLVATARQRKIGSDKRDTLPKYCRECDVRFACNGGCPKTLHLHSRW